MKKWWEKPFLCAGCKRNHGPKIDRFEMLDGRILCTRQYYRELNEQRARLIGVQTDLQEK